MKNDLEEKLFKFSKEYKVNSSSLCCYSVLFSALARDVSVNVYSESDIKDLCEKHGVAYKKYYHGVGQVYSLKSGDKEFYLNKTKFLDGFLPKEFSKKDLKNLEGIDFKSPKGVVFRARSFNENIIERNDIKYPVVLKPVGGSMGKGVYLDIRSYEELSKHVSESPAGELVVEEQVKGDEYRIYFIKGQYYGAVKRMPANVIGDGSLTISQLIKNKNRRKKDKNLPVINFDKALSFLTAKGMSENDVPTKGEFVPLTNVLGRSSGGDIYDVSENLPDWIEQKICSLGKYFTNNLCIGLDVIISNNDFFVIEANDRPQLSSLLTPDQGEGRNIANALVESLFPNSVLKYEVGPGVGNVKKAINVVRNKGKSLLIEPRFFDFSEMINKTNDRNYKDFRLPINSNRLMSRREAFSRGMSVSTWKNNSGSARWSISGPNRSLVFRENMPPSTSQSTRSLTNDKERTKKRLLKSGVSVPAGIRIKSVDTDAALKWFDSLGGSSLVVVKPFNGSGGKGVTSAIGTKSEMLSALSCLEDVDVVLEEHIHGYDYRLLVVDGVYKCAIKRDPAHVVGDGFSTIESLVEQKNKLRLYNPYNGKYPIKLDDVALQRIMKKGFRRTSILNFGEKLYLQDIANIGAGGDSENVTNEVHPDFIEIAERVYSSFSDLAFCGLDLITQDISQPAASQRYAVVEVNANCDFAIHHFPTKGEVYNAAGAILDALFPESSLAPIFTKKIRVNGKVQGVGFRKWFWRQAVIRSLNGFVSNHDDGSVFAVVQGSLSAIDDLVRISNKGSERSIVRSIEIEEVNDLERFESFVIH
ncbi:acylphosphatase [Vreelandella alkaliphila]|uniref:acylphosphatase n=1 Tax=Vreelandella alkaliphila TaxID=272774 RepID=UPI003FD8E300